MKKRNQEILEQVSKKLNIPYEVVNKAYNSYWEFVRINIVKLPLKQEISEEEFYKLKVNFNVPSLGKLHCNYGRLVGIKERFKRVNKLI